MFFLFNLLLKTSYCYSLSLPLPEYIILNFVLASMNCFREKFTALLFLCLFSMFSGNLIAQVTGRVEVDGKIKNEKNPVGGVTIVLQGDGVPVLTLVSKDNGSFTFNLILQKSYTITFSKKGLVSKVVEFNTKLPPDQADIIYQYPFDVFLINDVAGVSSNDVMTKPVARIAYNPTYENFMHDESYTKKIQSEQDLAKKSADEINKKLEQSRLDSLNKIWNDSLVRVKDRDAKLLVEKAEQDRIRKEQEKAKKDSLDRAFAASQAAAALAAKEKARQDSISLAESKAKVAAEVAEKHKQDSISNADKEAKRLEALQLNREKARQDSMDRALVQKNKLDSMNRVKEEATAKLKRDAELKALEKLRQDSIAGVNAALKSREKMVADSIAQAKIEEQKQKQLELARLKELEKAKQDSLAKAQVEAKKAELDLQKQQALQKAREKSVADSLAQVKVDEERLRLQEQARLKELEKSKQDSLAREKIEAKKAESEFLKQQALQKVKEKAAADSLVQVKIDEQKQKQKEEASLKEIESARQDSISKAVIAAKQAEAENLKQLSIQKTRAKFVSDSIILAKAEEKSRIEIEEKQKIKQKQDSISAAAIALKERQKNIAESTQRSIETAKLKAEADEIEKIKKQNELIALKKEEDAQKAKEAEENKRMVALIEKAKQDSVSAMQRLELEQEEARKKAKVLAEIEAQKQMLGKNNKTEEKPNASKPPKPVAAIPKIRDSDYREGVTEETVTESNRVIYRTVVKREGSAFNYQKITYTWGGVFYFKNETNMTQILFDQELKNAKTTFKQ